MSKSNLADLYRLKGECLLKQSTRRGIVDETTSVMAQGEYCLNGAIQIAQLQKAKSLELRALVSLARHYHQ